MLADRVPAVFTSISFLTVSFVTFGEYVLVLLITGITRINSEIFPWPSRLKLCLISRIRFRSIRDPGAYSRQDPTSCPTWLCTVREEFPRNTLSKLLADLINQGIPDWVHTKGEERFRFSMSQWPQQPPAKRRKLIISCRNLSIVSVSRSSSSLLLIQ